MEWDCILSFSKLNQNFICYVFVWVSRMIFYIHLWNLVLYMELRNLKNVSNFLKLNNWLYYWMTNFHCKHGKEVNSLLCTCKWNQLLEILKTYAFHKVHSRDVCNTPSWSDIYVYHILFKYLKGYKSSGVNKVCPLKFFKGDNSKNDGRKNNGSCMWHTVLIWYISLPNKIKISQRV